MEHTYYNPKGTIAIEVLVEHGGSIPLKHVVEHSPTGMTWGYYGSGPHDTALSILADYFEHVKRLSPKVARQKAAWLRHQFCCDFVSRFKDGWEVKSSDITTWVATESETVEA